MSASVSDPKPEYVRKKASGKTGSQSNGSLMRITPLAIYCHKIKDMNLFDMAIRSEVSLTHSSKVVQEAAICYCLAIKTLIETKGDRSMAYNEAKYIPIVIK